MVRERENPENVISGLEGPVGMAINAHSHIQARAARKHHPRAVSEEIILAEEGTIIFAEVRGAEETADNKKTNKTGTEEAIGVEITVITAVITITQTVIDAMELQEPLTGGHLLPLSVV